MLRPMMRRGKSRKDKPPVGPQDYPEFRLVQDGVIVAEVSGPRVEAIKERLRYVAQYCEDGPLHTEERILGKWVRLS